MHKAPGPDALNARVKKESSSQISRILVLIFIRAMYQMVGDKANVPIVFTKGVNTVSRYSYAPPFQGPHF